MQIIVHRVGKILHSHNFIKMFYKIMETIIILHQMEHYLQAINKL